MSAKAYTLISRNSKGRLRVRAFKTREGRDRALLSAYLLFHRASDFRSAELADPDGYRVEEKS